MGLPKLDLRPAVHVLADSAAKERLLRSALEPAFRVVPVPRQGLDPTGIEGRHAVIDVDLQDVKTVMHVKAMMPALRAMSRCVFVVDRHIKKAMIQAHALGATNIMFNPVHDQRLVAMLTAEGEGAEDGSIESLGLVGPAAQAAKAASGGQKALLSLFSAVTARAPVSPQAVEEAGRAIADNIAETSLTTWLDTVRQHHEGTFQHCLLVTGVAVGFGQRLGLNRNDIQRLATAGMFHDVGKASIPLEILDKPGRLDGDELAIMRSHPVIGYDAIVGTAGVSDEVADVVRHHHEFLDGSGYPDALQGHSISDLCRIMTISDIFAALIENRKYKPPMPREDAYEIIRGMTGKLEAPLVAAFRDVALKA